MIENEIAGSKLWIVHLYQEQLDKFAKLGLGNLTENGVKVTEKLVAITQKRLSELAVVYDRKITPRAHALRRAIKRGQAKEKLLNGQLNSNGTTAAQGCEDNSSDRHEGKES